MHGDFVLKGLYVSSWIEIFNSCFNYTEHGFQQWCFPDDNPLYCQPNYVPRIFTLIKQEAEKQISKKLKKD